MIRINLLPVRAARKKETLRQYLVVCGVVILMVLAGIGYAHWQRSQKIENIKAEIKKKEAEIAKLETIIGEVGKLKNRKKSLEDKSKVIEKLKNGRQGPVRLMDELSNVIPKKAWILSFSENGASITLTGEAVNEEVISDMMINMDKSAFFGDVKLTQITNSGSEANPKKAFGLSARLLNPAEGQLSQPQSSLSNPSGEK